MNCSSQKAVDQQSSGTALMPQVTLPEQDNSTSTSAIGSPPIITEQPTPKYEVEGTWVELRVSTQGPNYGHVQWYKNSVPVAGATSGSYSFQISDSTIGYYAALVYYDSNNMTTSEGVYVAKAPSVAPQITTHPTSTQLGSSAGSSVTLFAGYTGNPFPSIQWYKDGVAVSGANSASLVVTQPGSYSYFIWNSAGYANSLSATVTQSQSPPVNNSEIKGIAFSLSYNENGVENLRVGHLRVLGDGTTQGQYYYIKQSEIYRTSSSINGYSSSGARCSSEIGKTFLYKKTFTGTVSINVNTITLVMDGKTIVFNRTLGSKKIVLASVDGISTNVGYGFASPNELSTPAVGSTIANSLYEAKYGEFFHKRGSEAWWYLNPPLSGSTTVMGLSAHAHRDAVSSGVYYSNQYDSLLFGQAPDSNVVYRHFGTDFRNLNCNNPDGHIHFMYGFGEGSDLMGFVGVEASPSLDGNYVSVFRYLKYGISY